MALGTDDVEAAFMDHFVVKRLPFTAQGIDLTLFLPCLDCLICLKKANLLFDITAQHNVSTSAGHIGRNGDHAWPTGLGNNLGLTRVLLGIEHLMGQLLLAQQPRYQFGVFDRGCTDQHRLSSGVAVADIGKNRLVFFMRGAKHLILAIIANHWAMRGHHYGFEAINLLKLEGFGICRACHAGQLAIHPEIILKGNRSQRLVLGLYRYTLLGFNGLMQAI